MRKLEREISIQYEIIYTDQLRILLEDEIVFAEKY